MHRKIRFFTNSLQPAERKKYMDQFTTVNGLKIHYLDYPGDDPVLILLPGLTVNAHAFDGLIRAGIHARNRVIAVDFRGRGLSDKPESGYSMGEYAADIVGLMDNLGVATAVVCGHSFGALVGMVLAANHPQRFPKFVIIDSSHLILNPQTVDLVKASLERLNRSLPSMDVYLAAMRKMPFLDGYWDTDIENAYRTDVRIHPDGSVQSQTTTEIIAETIDNEFKEPWNAHVKAIKQPVILLNAPRAFGPPGTAPILSEVVGQETADLYHNCQYIKIPGNHYTMIFGDNAPHIVAAIDKFVNG